MELKRTILAVVLSMAVLLVFQNYLAPQKPPVPKPQAQPGARAVTPVPEAQVAKEPGAAPVPTEAHEAEPRAPVSRAVIENDLVSVELSNRAAAVVGAQLKDYRDRAGSGGQRVELLSAQSGLDVAGAVRLVTAMPNWGAVFDEVERGSGRVVYAWEDSSGLRLEKTYELQPGRYDLALSVRLINGSTQSLRDRLGLVMVQDFSDLEDRYAFTGPAYYLNGKYEELKLKKIEDGVQASGQIDWAAFLEKYFLVAAVPDRAEGSALTVGAHLGSDAVAELALDGPVFDLEPGAEATFGYRIYLGPKWSETLAPLGSHLDEVVHYGFFHVIAKPLAEFLNVIYRFTGNYGIAIILLTTVIKALFWPLSARSFKSMQRMKEIQPKMQRLKERYGNDRERLNMEVMQLYKTHKVNPLGGCLPMLVQIPFFFALYKILLSSIELRHAPFAFWIQDLSAKDPYYITPLLMGASMFLQQKMTPATGGNEAQMKMMMYGMPVVFTFLFLNFPSGLVIYWLVNNVLSIAQQAMMLKKAKTA